MVSEERLQSNQAKIEQWLQDHSDRISEIAEQHDHLGTFWGIVNTTVGSAELMFEHAILIVDRDDLRVLAERPVLRLDEL